MTLKGRCHSLVLDRCKNFLLALVQIEHYFGLWQLQNPKPQLFPNPASVLAIIATLFGEIKIFSANVRTKFSLVVGIEDCNPTIKTGFLHTFRLKALGTFHRGASTEVRTSPIDQIGIAPTQLYDGGRYV